MDRSYKFSPIYFIGNYFVDTNKEGIVRYILDNQLYPEYFENRYPAIYTHYEYKKDRKEEIRDNSFRNESFIVQIKTQLEGHAPLVVRQNAKELLNKLGKIFNAQKDESDEQKLLVDIRHIHSFIDNFLGEKLIDWESIYPNTEVYWSSHLLDKFSRKVDFKLLSSLSNVEWSLELLAKYYTKWNWEALSGNPTLPWSEKLIGEFYYSWTWKPNHHLNNYEALELPSLSTNHAIKWTMGMFQQWLSKLNLWCVASVAEIDDNAIMLFSNEFDKLFITDKGRTRVSKGEYEDYQTYSDSWSALRENPNFKITATLLHFLYRRYASNSEGDVCLLDLLREAPLVGIEDTVLRNYTLLANRNYLYTPFFINKSIWSQMIEKNLELDDLKDLFSKYERKAKKTRKERADNYKKDGNPSSF